MPDAPQNPARISNFSDSPLTTRIPKEESAWLQRKRSGRVIGAMLRSADLAPSILQGLYESEINFTVSAFWDCGFRWSVGDPLNGFVAEGSAATFEKAVSDLAQAAIQHFPGSAFARSYRS